MPEPIRISCYSSPATCWILTSDRHHWRRHSGPPGCYSSRWLSLHCQGSRGSQYRTRCLPDPETAGMIGSVGVDPVAAIRHLHLARRHHACRIIPGCHRSGVQRDSARVLLTMYRVVSAFTRRYANPPISPLPPELPRPPLPPVPPVPG